MHEGRDLYRIARFTSCRSGTGIHTLSLVQAMVLLPLRSGRQETFIEIPNLSGPGGSLH